LVMDANRQVGPLLVLTGIFFGGGGSV